jgi:hypothetical protein
MNTVLEWLVVSTTLFAMATLLKVESEENSEGSNSMPLAPTVPNSM